MTLELIPNNELTFKGPFNNVSITMLKLSNTGNDRLAYKIKTTAPKRYCVKPNSGFLDAHTTTEVQVMLQPQAAGQLDDRAKHKFMVQWTAVSSTSAMTENIDNFWKQDLKTFSVQDAKLKCLFMEDQPTANASESQPSPSNVELSNTSENRAQGHQTYSSATSRPSPPSAQPVYVAPSSNPTRPQVGADDSNKGRNKDEVERLKDENEVLKDRLKQQETTLRQRLTAGDRAGVINGTDHSKLTQQRPGLFVLGIQFNEQLVLVAIVTALLFGFSLGYFLFSCGN